MLNSSEESTTNTFSIWTIRTDAEAEMKPASRKESWQITEVVIIRVDSWDKRGVVSVERVDVVVYLASIAGAGRGGGRVMHPRRPSNHKTSQFLC